MTDLSAETTRRVLASEAAQATLSDAITAFEFLELRGLATATARWYTTLLQEMAADLGSRRPVGDVFEIDLEIWRAGMFARKQSIFTIHARLRATKRFFRWLYARGVMSADLGSGIKLPRLPRGSRSGVSEAAKDLIIDAARANPRDYALLLFIESTGCRRAGAANLRLADLNLDAPDDRLRRRAMVTEKGEKTREVVMTPQALQALEAWLAARPITGDARIFMLAPASVTALLGEYRRNLGIQGPASPHQWRHRWARTAIQNGMDISQVSQLLGHADIDVTNRYYGQFRTEQLQEAFDRSRGIQRESR